MLEQWFEHKLWMTRWVVMFAVIFGLLAAFAMFYITTVDLIFTFGHLLEYTSLADEARYKLRADTVAHIVGAVDGYLLGVIMLIFALGLYELFISEIDVAKSSPGAGRILVIHTLDDLKDRLAKVILMILVVIFFEYAIHLSPTNALELLYFALGILLVSLALYFAHKGGH